MNDHHYTALSAGCENKNPDVEACLRQLVGCMNGLLDVTPGDERDAGIP